MTEEQIMFLIEEAECKYPVGTIFHSTGGNTNCVRYPGSTFSVESDESIIVSNQPKSPSKYGYTEGRIRNHNGEWAEIINIEPKIINQFPIY